MQSYKTSERFFRNLFENKLFEFISRLHNLETAHDALVISKMNKKPSILRKTQKRNEATVTTLIEHKSLISEAESASANSTHRTGLGSCGSGVQSLWEEKKQTRKFEESINPHECNLPRSNDQNQHLKKTNNFQLIGNITNCQNIQTVPYVPQTIPSYGYQNFIPLNGDYNHFQPYQMESAYSLYSPFSDRVLSQNALSNVYFHRQPEYGNQQPRSGSPSCNHAKNKRNSVSKLRLWENVLPNGNGKNKGFVFKVMSYNVLAQTLIDEHQYLYHGHEKRSLEWNVRWNNLFREIRDANPEILCLQEVQNSHIPKFYNRLKELGYEGIYKQRTGIRLDGCAIYYKKNILSLVEYTTVEFHQPSVNVLNRDNVAIIMKLSPKINPSQEFLVATTHLLYNPRRQDVRLAQTQLLLTEIDRLAFKGIKNGGGHLYVPIILTGDFNSTPDSAVYELIVRSSLEYQYLAARTLEKNSPNSEMGKKLVPATLGITDHCQHADLVEKRTANNVINREEETRIIRLHHTGRPMPQGKNEITESACAPFATGTLKHNFSIMSAYKHVLNGEVEGTTYQNEWITVDYIFYSGRQDGTWKVEDKLKLLSRYVLPTRGQLKNITIPNSEMGSDHLALLVKFRLEY